MSQPAVNTFTGNPVVPDISPGVARLFKLLSDSDLGVMEIAEELSLYPVVGARLIGLANSAWSSPINPVQSLPDACSRLGLGVVRSTSIAYAVSAPFNTQRCPQFDPFRFWCGCLLASEGARVLAEDKQVDTAVASTAAMLRNLGLLWLADVEPELIKHALRAAEESGESLTSLVSASIGMSHLDATVYLLGAWGFSAELRDACAPDSTDRVAWVVHKAAHIADSTYIHETQSSDSAIPDSLAALQEPELDALRAHLCQRMAKTVELAKTIAA